MKKYKALIFGVIAVVLGLVIALLPAPAALTRNAMVYLGVLVATVILLIAQAFPDYVIVLAGLGVLALVGTFFPEGTPFSFNALFAPFGQSTYWLILFAFALNTALNATGLLKRILPRCYRLFPRSYFGRVLFLTVTSTLICPLVPSTNAKASLLAPAAETTSRHFGFEKNSRGAAGLFAAMLIPATVTAQAFFSGSGTVYIALGLMNATEDYSWFSWLNMTWLWLVLTTVLCVVAILLIYRPEHKTPLGNSDLETVKTPMSRQEIAAAIILVATFLLWGTQSLHGVSYVLVALFSFVAMCLTGVFKKEHLSKLPWGMLTFIGGLLSIASLMGTLGVKDWLVEVLGPVIAPFTGSVYIFIPFVCILTYLSRFVIISQSTNYAVIYLALAPFAETVGMNPVVLMFIITAATNIWTLSFHNTAYLSAMGAGGSEMVEHKTMLPMSYAYMVIHILTSMACVPLWQLIGLVR